MVGNMISGTIMAHPRRREWAEWLSGQTGLPVVWDTTNTVWDTAKAAWREAVRLDPDATHALVLQDDAIPCRDLIPTLEVISGLYPLEPFCLTVIDYRLHGAKRDYEQTVQSGAPFWYSNAAISAVGLMIPVRDVEPMIASGDRFATIHDDLKVRNFYKQQGRKLMFPIPSLLQHRNVDVNPSLVPGNDGRWSDRSSSTFIGEGVSGLSVDWAGTRPGKARPIVQFRNVRTGERISVPNGSKAAAMLLRRSNWERVDVPPVQEPSEQYDPLVDPPARQGPGSSRAAWEAYAHLLGIETASMTRTEIIEACDAR
jgi:hypothetical protein